MTEQAYTLAQHGFELALAASGLPSRKWTQGEATAIREDLFRNGTDAEFEEYARTIATAEVRGNGGDYQAEFDTHLAWLKRRRAELQAATVATPPMQDSAQT